MHKQYLYQLNCRIEHRAMCAEFNDRMMLEPLVGIALAIYKPNVEFLRAQLQSISEQTYSNWFCIAGCDSPISDFRNEISLRRFFEDPRFEFIQNESTRGVSGNFESTAIACIAKNPKYIAFSDQDDIWYSNKTSRLVAELIHCPPMSVVHCDMRILKSELDGSSCRLGLTAWQLEHRGVKNSKPVDFLIRNMAAGAGMLLDAQLIQKYPAIPADEFGHDHWYPLVASYFGVVRPIFEPLYDYRIHDSNVAGISEYRGLLHHSRSSRAMGLANKCVSTYELSKARLKDAENAHLPVKTYERVMTSLAWDFSLLYFAKAAVECFSDPALARACIARGIGKLMHLFGRPLLTFPIGK